MQKSSLSKKKLPSTPGVYFFLGTEKEILYIGKATNLNNRVRSYFATDLKEKRSELIERMVKEAKTVEWTVTDSVLEALLLEVNLIRTHKPKYNTISKDDKSYNHLVITNEKWPRVLVVRAKDLAEKFTPDEILYEYGPFPSSGLFREALKIVRKLFKFYDTKDPLGKEKSKISRGKIDFNRQIGLFPEETDHKEYKKTIHFIQLFFSGKKKEIIKELEKEMLLEAKKENFETAAIIKRKIFALKHIEDISLLKDENRIYRDEKTIRIEAYDVAHLGGEDMVGVMSVVEGGELRKSEYRKFKIQTIDRSNDPGALKEILNRRLTHPEWPLPQIIVVDGGKAQKNVAEMVLQKAGLVIPVVAVVKDERHKPVRLIAAKKILTLYENEILLANADAHRFAITYHKQKRRKNFLN